MSEIGDNSKEQLRSIIERIENVETQVKELNADKGDIYSEAKGSGYDVKTLRTIVRMRKEDPEDKAAREALIETYMHALGMLA